MASGRRVTEFGSGHVSIRKRILGGWGWDEGENYRKHITIAGVASYHIAWLAVILRRQVVWSVEI